MVRITCWLPREDLEGFWLATSTFPLHTSRWAPCTIFRRNQTDWDAVPVICCELVAAPDHAEAILEWLGSDRGPADGKMTVERVECLVAGPISTD